MTDPNAAYDDLVRHLEAVRTLTDDGYVLEMADRALSSLYDLVKHLQQGGHEPDAWAPDNNPPSSPEEAAWLRARGL